MRIVESIITENKLLWGCTPLTTYIMNYIYN